MIHLEFIHSEINSVMLMNLRHFHRQKIKVFFIFTIFIEFVFLPVLFFVLFILSYSIVYRSSKPSTRALIGDMLLLIIRTMQLFNFICVFLAWEFVMLGHDKSLIWDAIAMGNCQKYFGKLFILQILTHWLQNGIHLSKCFVYKEQSPQKKNEKLISNIVGSLTGKHVHRKWKKIQSK